MIERLWWAPGVQPGSTHHTWLSPFPHVPATLYEAGHAPSGTFWSVGSVADLSASVPIGFPFSVWKYLVFPGVPGPN